MKVIRGRKTRRKILAVILSVCMMFTASPNLWDTVMVQAAETIQNNADARTVEKSAQMMVASDSGTVGANEAVNVRTIKVYGYDAATDGDYFNADKFSMPFMSEYSPHIEVTSTPGDGYQEIKITCTLTGVSINFSGSVWLRRNDKNWSTMSFMTKKVITEEREMYGVKFWDGTKLLGMDYTAASGNGQVSEPAAPTKENATFAGWVTKDGGNTAFDFSEKLNAATDVYASWNWTSYDVTLHENGGSGSPLTSYIYGTGAVLPTGWTKTGYTFDGWYDNEGFDGEKVTEISATDTGDKEYWAKWTDNIAPVIGTITYNYQPKKLWNWLIGKDSLVITVPVTEEGSGADKITYTVTPDGGTAREETANITDGKAEITVSADFKGTISVVCTDKAGNTSASVTVGAGLGANGIIIEDNAPQIAFQAENAELLPSGEYKTVPDIAVTVADDKNNVISGGIASVSYKIGNGSEKTVGHDYTTGMVVNDSFTIPASEISAEEMEITVTATDNAGNSVTQNYTVKVHTHSGTLVSEVEPTCTTAGNKEYYTCTCGEEFSDSGCTNEITDHTEVVKKALGHDFTGDYQFDTEEHWKKCSRCPATDSREAHSFEEGSNHCTKCEFEKAGEGHTHRGELHERVEPTCTTKGNTAYYTCNCGKWFSDSSCTEEITDKSKIEIAALEHDFSGEYQSDENGHWKVCSRCNVAQAAESHVFDDDNDTDCNQCGYRRNIGNQGNVSKDVEKDEKAPDTVLSNSAEELGDIILTEEEKGQIGNGTDIKFILDVKDAGDTVSSGDKTAVQQALDGNTAVKGFSAGQYLDISLFKVIGDTRSAISQTARKLTIVINVPESLKSKDSTKPRTYAIIRVHDGVTEVLEDLDSDADTVTIATDRFSAYALVYKEAGSGADVTPSPTPGGGDKPTPTPGGVTPSPTPGGATPSPMPGGSTPSPTPGGATPSPTPGGATPSPTPGGATPVPTPGGATPVPTLGGATPSPTPGGATPSPTPGEATPSPTPGGSTPNPTPGESTPNPVPEQQKEVNRIAKELNVPVETAKKLQEMAEELGIETDTLLLTNQDIVNQDSEGDVKGSFFSKLQAKATKAKKNSITLKWNKVKGASGYQIYAAKCGKNKKYKLVKTIKKASTTSFTYKKLKKGTGYKLIVKAYKNVDGKEYTVAASKTVHEVTEGGKNTNPKSVKVNKRTVKIKNGKKFKIKSKIVKASSGKKLANHRRLSYESTNKEIATVSKKGVIKGKKAGTCYIYVYAENGIFKKIKVTVKK